MRVIYIGVLLALLAAPSSAQDAPLDLRVELRTATGSNRFQVGEVIPLEVSYSSTAPNRYLEPCELFSTRSFGYPQCRFFSRWTFDISPINGVVDLAKEFGGPMTHSGPTFEVPSRDLAQDPSIYSYPLTNRFRFEKPGEYHVHFSTEVGIDDETTQIRSAPFNAEQPRIKPHAIPITRDLVLTIIPADPAWETTVIANGIKAFEQAGSRDTRETEFKKQESARLALCTLGSPDAVRAMARLLANDPPQSLRVCRENTTGREDCYEMPAAVDLQKCIRQSRSTDVAIDEMQKLLIAPDVAVRLNFFNLLVTLLGNDPGRREGMIFLDARNVDSAREKLFAALPQKNSEAFLPSLITVISSPPRARNSPAEFSYEQTFSPQIIATVAEHIDELPYDIRQRLFIYEWERLRSPVMAPVVRRLAESGDGEALLRWRELDPQSATAFIRQEVVRPVPRFSSYYLRVPEPLSSVEQKQITDNFLALVPKLNKGFGEYAVARSATLLQAYGTERDLPAVLPVIDANLLNWPCTLQFPVLAYLLKVSPKQAAPRVAKALAAANHGMCVTNTFLTSIGFLQPSPVLERLALEQIDLGKSPLARDAADYLRRYASKEMKSAVWERLRQWSKRLKESGAEARSQAGKITPEENQQIALFSDLTETYVAAQAWVLTPEEAQSFRKLVGDKLNDSAVCRFHCGDELSIAAHKGQFLIYSHINDNADRIASPLEYLNSSERLRYAVSQYRCANMKALKYKLLQFPAGSEFVFAYDFTPRDRDEIVQISDFLREHGYKVANPWHWPFLSPDPER